MSEDLIISSNKEKLTVGMFGQTLPQVLEVLDYLEKKQTITCNTKIIFNINTLNSHNIIPRFIVPKKLYKKEDGEEEFKHF